jgi:large subunit ribosomal protein L10
VKYLASNVNLEKKQSVIDEIKTKIESSNSVVFVEYQGLSVEQINELRKRLKETGSEIKIYKNTLVKRAINDLKLDLDEALKGPNAIAFSEDAVAPVKIISDFAKENDALSMKVGVIEGNISDITVLKELASIPSREGLLTMLAGGMIGIAKDLSICLSLYADQNDDGSTPKEEPKVEEAAPEVAPEETPVEEVKEETTEEAPAEEVKEETTEETPVEEEAPADEEATEEVVEEQPEEETKEEVAEEATE